MLGYSRCFAAPELVPREVIPLFPDRVAIGEISANAAAYRPAVCTNCIDNPCARGRCLYSLKVIVTEGAKAASRGKMTHTRNSLNRGRIDPQRARVCGCVRGELRDFGGRKGWAPIFRAHATPSQPPTSSPSLPHYSGSPS